MTVINPIQSGLPGLSSAGSFTGAKPAGQSTGIPNLFGDLLNAVNELQAESGVLEKQMYEGEPVDLHSVMIAAEQAGTTVELLSEIRNRLVDTFQQLMRMQI